MTKDEIRAIVLELLADAAPELDNEKFRTELSFRDQLDMDSFDLLNFFVALSERYEVPISGRESAALQSVDDCCQFIAKARSTTG